MVPAAIVTLDAMPLTGSGKVDYRALPSPARDGARAAAYVAPASDMERRVAAIWTGVLGLDEVGAADNFFDVGGHSLKLVEVHERLQTTLGRAIPIVELFRYPTVAGLAAYLSQASGTREDGVVGAAEARAARQRAALTTKARGAR